MQKGKGVRGGLRRGIVPVIMIILCTSSAYPEEYGLPGAVERGMGGVVLPGLSRVDVDSLSGRTIFITSVSYSNPYSIEGLDALNLESILVNRMMTLRAAWKTLGYDAFREDRWGIRIYAGPRYAQLWPFITMRMFRLRAGSFETEKGHDIETGLVLLPGHALTIEATLPVSCRPSGRLRPFALCVLLRWGSLDICGDLRFPAQDGPASRYGIRVSLAGGATLLAGYDNVSTTVSGGIVLWTRGSTFVFSREYHPVLGGTCSFGVERVWSR